MASTSQTHIVHKQVIDLHVSSKSEAKIWQDKISDLLQKGLMSKLEKACNEICSPDETIRIDKLELDLGKLSVERFDEHFESEVVKIFRNEIVKDYYSRLNLMSDKNQKNQKKLTGVSEKSLSQNDNLEDAFIHYFQNGTWPWWSKKIESGMVSKIWNEQLEKGFINFSKSLKLSKPNDHAIKRLVHLTEQNILFDHIDPVQEWKVEELYDYLLKNNYLKRSNNKFFLDFIRYSEISKRSIPETKALLFLATLSRSGQRSVEGEIRKISKSAYLPVDIQNVWIQNLTLFEKVLQAKKPEKGIKNLLTNDLSLDQIAEIEIPSIVSVEKSKGQDVIEERLLADKARDDTTVPNTNKSAENDESILVPNAGAVILWPYLQMFFKELRLLHDGQFVDPDKQARAVQLLHYLVCGVQEADDCDWPLLKLLCGLQIDEFVLPEFELNNEEKQECENLLSSVIRNWPVLKNTKPQSLQASFLCRVGLLKKEQNGWIAHIERTGIDVLLDKINWPISVIRLPWNDYMIHVQW